MHFKIFKMIATSGFLTAVECTKSVFGRGSARTPLGELTTLPRPPSRLGRGHPSPFPTPSTRSASRSRRLRRLVLGASFSKPPPKFFSGYGPACSCRRCSLHTLQVIDWKDSSPQNDLQCITVAIEIRHDSIIITSGTFTAEQKQAFICSGIYLFFAQFLHHAPLPFPFPMFGHCAKAVNQMVSVCMDDRRYICPPPLWGLPP